LWVTSLHVISPPRYKPQIKNVKREKNKKTVPVRFPHKTEREIEKKKLN
jgi:hypothetical protein